MLPGEKISDAALQLREAGRFYFLPNEENEIERLQLQLCQTDGVLNRRPALDQYLPLRVHRLHHAANSSRIA